MNISPVDIHCQLYEFDNIENKHTLYRGKNSMKKFWSLQREHATNIMEKMLMLTKKELKLKHNVTECYICGKKFPKDKNYRKVRDHCHCTGKYRGAAHTIGSLRFNMPHEIPVVFYNGLSFYHKCRV